MEVLRKVLREYTLIMAVVTAFFAMGTGLEWWSLTTAQIGLVMAFIAAVFAVLRFVVTPTSDPVLKPGTVVNAHTDRFPTSTVTSNTE